MTLYAPRHHQCRTDEFLWRGHRLVVIENELLRAGVLASKGADIIELRYKPLDLDVLWHASQTVLPPGQKVASVARPQGSFLDYFEGGWQEVLPNAGPATRYRGAELGQHGEASLLPWDVKILDDRADRVEVQFSVELLRTPFRLERSMALESGSPILQFRERVINLGEEELAYAWGHHPAFGAPFLEAGCRIDLPRCEAVVPASVACPKRRYAVERPSPYPYLVNDSGQSVHVDEVPGKEAGTEDVVLFSKLEEGWCALRNPRLELAVGMVWDTGVYPYMWCWQVYGGSWGYPYYGRAYTVALEPFNCPPLPLEECVRQQQAAFLAPGAEVTSRLEAGIFRAAGRVRGIGFGGHLRFSEDD